MKKFKEKKYIEILYIAAMITFVLWLLTLISFLFTNYFAIGFMLLLVSGVLSTIASTLSKRKIYSSNFIKYMKNKLKSAKSLNELKEILVEFGELAIDKGAYNLSYPTELKEIHSEIINKIEILEKK